MSSGTPPSCSIIYMRCSSPGHSRFGSVHVWAATPWVLGLQFGAGSCFCVFSVKKSSALRRQISLKILEKGHREHCRSCPRADCPVDKPELRRIKLKSARCLTEGLYHPLRWECWQKDSGDEPQKSDGVDKRGVLSGPVHQHSHRAAGGAGTRK